MLNFIHENKINLMTSGSIGVTTGTCRCVCETLMSDVLVPEAHQNDCSYTHELSELTFDSLRKI